MTKKQTFATALAMLGSTFNREINDVATDAYWLVLGDLSALEIATAAKRAIATCRFMPSPAELLSFVGRDPAARMAESWEAVRSAMDRFDYTRSVDFGPLVNAVVRNIGGWTVLCASSIPDLVWRRKDFERVYQAFAGKAAASLNGAPLTGALPGSPVRVAIAGELPPVQTSALPAGVSPVARQLAEAKS